MDATLKPEYVPCVGVFNIPAFVNKKIVGRATLTHHLTPIDESDLMPEMKEAIVLLDIVIYNNEYRKKGIADKLMNHITNSFDIVMTGMSTKSGRSLCLKHGFKFENHDGRPYLIYRKESDELKKLQEKGEQGAIG